MYLKESLGRAGEDAAVLVVLAATATAAAGGAFLSADAGGFEVEGPTGALESCSDAVGGLRPWAFLYQ